MKSSADRVLIWVAASALASVMVMGIVFLAFTGKLSGLFSDHTVLLKSNAYALGSNSFGHDEAQRAMSEGDWEKALGLLEPLARTSENINLRRAYGISLFNAAIGTLDSSNEEHLLDRAAERLMRSLDFIGDEPGHTVNVTRALSSIGLKQYEDGSREKGRAKMELAHSRYADDPYVCYVLGAIMAREGYLSKAHPLLVTGCLSDEENVKAAATEILAKIQADVKEESSFSVEENGRFILRYDGPPRPDVASRIISILESESPRVGSLVGHLPSRKVEVIVYTKEEFASARGLPDWVGGLFDGRIRVSLGDVTEGDNRLREILSHEFSHASVFDMLGRAAPTWLDEGIAQVLEKGSAPSAAMLKSRISGSQTSLAQLSGQFMGMNSAQATAAYAYSYATVAYIISRNGAGAIPAILTRYNSEKDIDAALRYAIGRTTAELDVEVRQWMETTS